MISVRSYATHHGITYPIAGEMDEKFTPVLNAFIANFSRGEENGAAVCVEIDGHKVVDLWGGYRDLTYRDRWERDTIVCTMSVTKAMTAACLHMLVDRGLVEIDAPAARYWPEFAQGGKDTIPVRYLMDHRAGLAVLDHVPAGGIYDWQAMTGALARQTPNWTPGEQSGYHVLTHGFLLGELVRRVSGKSPGTFFRDEVAGPLGLDFRIGMPEADFGRCATFIPAIEGTLLEVNQKDPDSIRARAWVGCPLTEDFNSSRWRTAEIPGANGHGNARAVARFYSALACGGAAGGVRLMRPQAVAKMGEESHHLPEIVLGRRYHQTYGVVRNSPPYIYMGPNPNTFGHHGVGGAIGCCDPDARIAFSYTMNQMHARLDNGPRGGSLIDAVYRSVDSGFAGTWDQPVGEAGGTTH